MLSGWQTSTIKFSKDVKKTSNCRVVRLFSIDNSMKDPCLICPCKLRQDFNLGYRILLFGLVRCSGRRLDTFSQVAFDGWHWRQLDCGRRHCDSLLFWTFILVDLIGIVDLRSNSHSGLDSCVTSCSSAQRQMQLKSSNYCGDGEERGYSCTICQCSPA